MDYDNLKIEGAFENDILILRDALKAELDALNLYEKMLAGLQVEKAKALLKNAPIGPQDHSAWNEATREQLVKIFGPRSPNISTIVFAPGRKPIWLGMEDDVYQRYLASSMEHKIERLNSCIVSLRLKAAQSESDQAG